MPPQTIYPNSMGFQIKYNDPSDLGEKWCPLQSYILNTEYTAWHTVVFIK